MILYTCIPSTQNAEVEGSMFQASLGYIMRPPSQKGNNKLL
jgi:hypothetical protein